MNINNLEIAIEKLYEAKQFISAEKIEEEDTYYSTPETERDEDTYHCINTLDIITDELNEMIDDLNLMRTERSKYES